MLCPCSLRQLWMQDIINPQSTQYPRQTLGLLLFCLPILCQSCFVVNQACFVSQALQGCGSGDVVSVRLVWPPEDLGYICQPRVGVWDNPGPLKWEM